MLLRMGFLNFLFRLEFLLAAVPASALVVYSDTLVPHLREGYPPALKHRGSPVLTAAKGIIDVVAPVL